MKNKEENNLIFNIKKIENKINNYINTELNNKDLQLKYLKIKKNNKLNDKDNNFYKKFIFLYNYIKNKLDNENIKTEEKNVLENIIKIFPKDKVFNLKNFTNTSDAVNHIISKFKIEKTIQNIDDEYKAKLFIINKNNKKYFLKIKEISYDYEYSIKKFMEECKRWKDASMKNLSPAIDDAFIYIYKQPNKYYNKDYYYSKKDEIIVLKISIVEYINGINFKEYINTKKFINDDIKIIKKLIIELHKIGIFHGNITPENIIYNKNYKKDLDKFKFIDFSESNTCETISKKSLNKNIESIEQLGINHNYKKYLKYYIAIYELLNKKIINIIL